MPLYSKELLAVPDAGPARRDPQGRRHACCSSSRTSTPTAQADGTYSTNMMDAFNAINCVDQPRDAEPDFDAMRAEAAQIEAVAPTVGRFFGYGDTMCAKWPVPAVARARRTTRRKGAPPIVVVGTTNDPATPYAWAEQLAGPALHRACC